MTMIIKSSGDQALFDSDRLRQSLRRVGADEALIQDVIHEVKVMLVEGMSTHAIYKIAFRLLRKKARLVAAKYHLKRAIMHLGVSGFPFEKYVAEIMKHQGFRVKTNEIIMGRCVKHEVDIVAKTRDQVIFIECKYHNQPDLKSDVKIALYVKARFDDIEQGYTKNSDEILKGHLVTNTQFTQDAMQYSQCAGLELIAWDYPEKGSLKEQIEVSGLYPITCVTSFTASEIAKLLENNIILCKTISQNPAVLQELKIPKARLQSIIRQCQDLCH